MGEQRAFVETAQVCPIADAVLSRCSELSAVASLELPQLRLKPTKLPLLIVSFARPITIHGDDKIRIPSETSFMTFYQLLDAVAVPACETYLKLRRQAPVAKLRPARPDAGVVKILRKVARRADTRIGRAAQGSQLFLLHLPPILH